MTSPRYARLAARVVSDSARGNVIPPQPDVRAAVVAAVSDALDRRRRRLRMRRAIGGAISVAAVAAGIALVAWRGLPASSSSVATGQHAARTSAPIAPAATVTLLGHPTGAGAMVSTEGRETPLVDGALTLSRGSRIVTRASGGATVALANGSKLTLDEDAELSIESEGEPQVFALASGSVKAEVTKLSSGQRFVVRTKDAEVEVRGTVFRISHAPPVPGCGDGTVTRVAVTEGVVVVRHRGAENRVHAGERWPAGCVASIPPVQRNVVEPSARALPAQAPRPAAPVVHRSESASESASQLSDQNDMFARAMVARRAGNAERAVATFDELLAKYPRALLAESATVERMRTLLRVDPSRARSAAREYLVRYPNGFARVEAQTMVEQGK